MSSPGSGLDLGTIGIWRRHPDGIAVEEIEALGYGTVWVGGGPSLSQVRGFLRRTESLLLATGILNVWQHPAAEVARLYDELSRDFPRRVLLGVGVGHAEVTTEYRKPLETMSRYFDELDSADPPVAVDGRLAAALGPKMLSLAAQRSRGALTFLATPGHTELARRRLGPDRLLAAELTVVVDEDDGRARELARGFAAMFLSKRNYTANLRRLGFSERDLTDGGSDALIDSVIPHGSPERIRDAVAAHLDAGADHVCLQPLSANGDPLADYRALAAVLL